jgi:hypothetical protein
MAILTAASVIVNSRTPDSAALLVFTPGGGIDDSPFLYTRANLLTDLRPGPLRDLLARTPDWTVFNILGGGGSGVKDDFIRITKLLGGYGNALTDPNAVVIVVFAADSLNFSIQAVAAEVQVACGLLLELRAVHSNER